MAIRLYVDEDAMARAFVNGLRAREVDVKTVFEEGMVGRSDVEQLEHAADQGRVIYTFNVGDFCQLHTEFITNGKNHSGIVVVYRQRYAIGEQIRRMMCIIHTQSAEEIRNTLRFL